MAERGRYVRIEGADGAGKTTLIKLAQEYSDANGLNTLFIREPGETEFGKELRSLILTDTRFKLSPMVETLLFTADRSYTDDNVILPALEEGRIIVGDRGPESTDAYQSSGGGISSKVIEKLSYLAMPKRYMEPDAVVLLLLSPEERLRRMQAKVDNDEIDKIEERGEEFFARVDTRYRSMASRSYIHPTNADGTPDQIFDVVRPIIFGQEHA